MRLDLFKLESQWHRIKLKIREIKKKKKTIGRMSAITST